MEKLSQDFTQVYLHIYSQAPVLLFVSPVMDPYRLNFLGYFVDGLPVRFGQYWTLAGMWKAGVWEKPAYLSPNLSAPGCFSNSSFVSSVIPAPSGQLSLWLQLLLALGLRGHHLFLLSLQPWGPEVPTVLLAG